MYKLIFREQCDAFFARHLFRLNSEDLEVATKISDQIGEPKTDLYLAVPIHALESCLDRYLNIIIVQASQVNAQITFFFNAFNEQINEIDFTLRWQVAQKCILKYCNQYNYYNIFIISKLFDSIPTMGRIRGILTDGILMNAHKFFISNPIIVFNDVDIIDISPTYLVSYKKIFSKNINIKMSTGTVNYGYVGSQPNSILEGMQIPELFIFNEFNKAINKCAREGVINFEKRVLLEGTNMIFSGAAYCAVNGFEFEKKTGEDDAIGRAIHRYNPNAFTNSSLIENSIYEEDAILTTAFNLEGWVTTDPRRILTAISLTKPGIQAWGGISFMNEVAGLMNTHELIETCFNHKELITLEAINKSQMGDKESHQKILRRLCYILKNSCEYELKIRNLYQQNIVLKTMGIILKDENSNLSDANDIDILNSHLIQKIFNLK